MDCLESSGLFGPTEPMLTEVEDFNVFPPGVFRNVLSRDLDLAGDVPRGVAPLGVTPRDFP